MDTIMGMGSGVLQMRWKRWVVILSVLAGLYYLAPSLVVGALADQYLQPERLPLKSNPESFGLAYQDVTFPSSDKEVTLSGWLVQAKEQHKRIVIFAHGYKENRESAMVAVHMARALNRQGIASLLFDFRGAGLSEGTQTTFGYYERNDLLGAIAYAKRLGYDKIGLVGFSMGAATALEVAPDIPEVKAIVADSSYARMDSYLQDHLSKASPSPYLKIRPEVVMWQARLMTGIDPEEMQPVKAIAELKRQAVLLIHAEDDPVIPVSESEKLKAASGAAETQLWISDTHQHVGVYNAGPQEYVRRTTEFLAARLPVDPHDKLVEMRLERQKEDRPFTSLEVTQRRREMLKEQEALLWSTGGVQRLGEP